MSNGPNSPSVATFTDRPRRRAGEQGLPHFVHGWAADGFASDPPNAALVLHGAPSSRDVAMLTLSHPRYDRRAQRLTYTAKPLHGPGAKSLAGFSRRGDPLRPLGFHDASLFIDDAGSDTVTQRISLQVFSSQPEQVSLQIANDGPAVYWSLGRPGSPGSGLQVTSPNGSVSISNLLVTPDLLSFQTSSEAGAPISFVLNLYIEAEASAETFTIRAQGGPDLQITAFFEGDQTTIYPGLTVFPLYGV